MSRSKRIFDVVVSSILLLATAPVSLAAAAAVKLSSPGPVIYRAPRAGLHGHLFEMFKFRTMRIGLDDPNRRVTEVGDPRITAVGQILRRSKVDEIPQLANVLLGQMSIVGPRPEDIDIVRNHYTDEQRRTLEVRPGIASLAELQWYPDMTYHDPPPEGVSTQQWYVERHMPVELEESLRYIENQSLWMDLGIVARLAFMTVWYTFAKPPLRPLDNTGEPVR